MSMLVNNDAMASVDAVAELLCKAQGGILA